MAKVVVAREVALEEFARMCEARRVDIDESSMSKEDKKAFEDARGRIVGAIMRGELIVEDDGTPVFTPPVAGANSLKFYKATGATFMASDGATESVSKAVAMLQEVTRCNPGEISKLEAPDFKVCQAILQLFLA